jgi:hypothetical protein
VTTVRHTRDGTMIDLYEKRGIHEDEPVPGME